MTLQERKCNDKNYLSHLSWTIDSTTFWQSVSTHFCISLALVKEKYIILDISETRPGLKVNEIHSPYDRQHEVSSSPNPHLNKGITFLTWGHLEIRNDCVWYEVPTFQVFLLLWA